jgi:hypothetical protein
MRINTLNSTSSQVLRPGHTEALTLSRLAGELLPATVTGIDKEGQVTLKLAGQIIRVHTAINLMVGMELQVKVEKEGDAFVLRTTPDKESYPPVTALLKRLLPNQSSLKPLTENLARLEKLIAEEVRLNPAQGERLLQLKQSLHALVTAQSTTGQVTTAEGLKKAIMDSGQFLEQRLMTRPEINPASDFKGLLLKFAAQLIRIAAKLDLPPAQIAVPVTRQLSQKILHQKDSGQANLPRLMQLILTLLKQAEGNLSRIESQQLIAAGRQVQHPEQMIWLLELPVRHFDDQSESIKLRIQREHSRTKKGAGESTWNVSLTLDDERHGTVQANITLSQQQVSCMFRTESESTAVLFMEHLALLQQHLQNHGMEVNNLGCHHGLMEQEDEFKEISGNLLHIKV